MSYKALYRTYRPKNFEEVVGQEHIVATLKNIISFKKIGHAYLFAGPRGTGKTSVAHVFARAVNTNSIGQEQFGEMDIIEIDAASNNGVSEVRTIIENVNYSPTKGKYKVYIVDEVHMLTKGAFNALLKTLEEPPSHVIFILATTEPHKIPTTILSRTQRFNFRRIEDLTISNQLKEILDKENIKYDEESIKFIAKLSQGGMRDAISIAEQSAAFGNGELTFESISQVFGVVSISNQIHLLNLAYSGDAKNVMKITSRLLNNGIDIERLTTSLIDIFKDFIVLKKTEDPKLLTFLEAQEIEEITISVDYAYSSLDVLAKLLTEIRGSAVPRQLFELAMLKIVNEIQSSNVDLTEKTIIVETKKDIVIEKELVKTNEEFVDDASTEEIFEELTSEIEATLPLNLDQELNLDAIKDEEEDLAEQDDISNDILSTQEIPVGELNKVEDTSDIDVVGMFDTMNISNKKKSTSQSKSIDEIINMLVQAKRDKLSFIKDKWILLDNYKTNPKFKHFVELLQETKVIASGDDFVLLFSEKNFIIDGINTEIPHEDFIMFIKEFLGKNLYVAIISKEEYEVVKTEYLQMKSDNTLPEPHPIKVPTIKEKELTKEEEYGNSLFGDLFSS